MACPTCDHTMSHIGETIDGTTRRAIWWCPRCGTLRVDGFAAFDESPKLVERCREFEKHLFFKNRNVATVAEWGRLGVCESIHKPEDRTT